MNSQSQAVSSFTANRSGSFTATVCDLLRLLPEASVDLVLTDPPYGTTNLPFDKQYRRRGFDWEAWWAEVHRVAKPTAIICCFAAQPFTTDLITSNRKNFRYDLVWQKDGSRRFSVSQPAPAALPRNDADLLPAIRPPAASGRASTWCARRRASTTRSSLPGRRTRIIIRRLRPRIIRRRKPCRAGGVTAGVIRPRC